MSDSINAFKVSADSLQGLTQNLLTAWGMRPEAAEETAQLIVETDLWGVDSHGVSMLPFYEVLRDSGHWIPQAEPEWVRDFPSFALLDGGHGLGHRTAKKAMQKAVDKARQTGVAVVSVRHSNHFGAAGLYAKAAADQGFIGFVTSTSRFPMLVPTRARMPVLGTNPIAFAAPAGGHHPFVLDMATTTVAANKVKVYELNNEPIPAGWVLDAAGQPVTDSALGMDYVYRQPEGGLTPLGGTAKLGSHKGYGLGMLAEILSGPLAGAAFASLRAKDAKPNIGHFFLAIDPNAFRDEGAFETDLETIIDVLHNTPPMDTEHPVLVAGDPEVQIRTQRLREGIPLGPKLQAQLRELCQRTAVPYDLTSVTPM